MADAERRRRVRRIAGRIPRELRGLRSRLMLEDFNEQLGVVEVTCPACNGSGWLDRPRLEYCPVCCGFQEVPVRLADWFRCMLAAIQAERSAPVLRTPGARTRPHCPPADDGERLGRLAEATYRVHLSHFD